MFNRYPIHGGMQDWNYLQANCFELTIELGCRKYPTSHQLPDYLFENLNPLVLWKIFKTVYYYLQSSLKFSQVKLVQSVHMGIRGFVFNQKGLPIEDAVISVEGIAKNVTTDKLGDYWRLLTPNSLYTIWVHKGGYVSQSSTVFIKQLYQLNFTLYSVP